jgi:hypothetical protein
VGELYIRRVTIVITPQSGAQRTLSGLRMKFKCEKTTQSNANKASVDIYNASPETRDAIEAGGTRIALYAGYEMDDPLQLVFCGDITKVKHKKKITNFIRTEKIQVKAEGHDIVTKIEVGDGDNRLRNSRHHKGYPPGIPLRNVLEDVAGSFKLPLGSFEGIPDVRYANGLSLQGPSRFSMDDLTSAHGLEWSVQDGSLQLTPRRQPASGATILISSDSGMVGVPERTSKGIEFASLLNPGLRPGRLVQVKSRIASGTFKLQKVCHDGDSHEGTFTTKCEATEK